MCVPPGEYKVPLGKTNQKHPLLLGEIVAVLRILFLSPESNKQTNKQSQVRLHIHRRWKLSGKAETSKMGIKGSRIQSIIRCSDWLVQGAGYGAVDGLFSVDSELGKGQKDGSRLEVDSSSVICNQ